MNDGEASWAAVIIEDDPDVRGLLDIVLTQSGFSTVLTANGHEGVEAVRRHNPLLTTLDLSMPGMDGFAAAKRIREFSSTYLIMVTARADEIDVVTGFEAGADDYLVKPFRARELRARVESMLRRPRDRQGVFGPNAGTIPPAPIEPAVPAGSPVMGSAPTDLAVTGPAGPAPRAPTAQVKTTEPAADGWIRYKGLALNPATRTVTLDGVGADLTRTEFDLLESLLGTGRRVRSKADLVLTMHGQSYVTNYVTDADKRSVEVHIANLRRKIGDNSATPLFVETVRGVGYRMASNN